MNETCKSRVSYREQTDGCQRGGELGDRVKNVKGSRSTDRWLQNSHGDVKYSIRNIVIIVQKLCIVPGGCWKYQGDHCKVYECLTTMLYT